jgi:hypothetical protein
LEDVEVDLDVVQDLELDGNVVVDSIVYPAR